MVAVSTRLIRPVLRSKLINRHRNAILLFFETQVKRGNYVLSLDNSFLLLSSALLLRHLHALAQRCRILTKGSQQPSVPLGKWSEGSPQNARELAISLSQMPQFPWLKKDCQLFLALLDRHAIIPLLRKCYVQDTESKKQLQAFRRVVRQVAWKSNADKYILQWVKMAGLDQLPLFLAAVAGAG